MLYHRQITLALAWVTIAVARTTCGQTLAAAGRPPLVLSRQQAIDSALARNPQLRVAAEQIAQARARGVESTAFPDPTFSADLTGEQSVGQPGTNTGSDAGIGLAVPFPTKFLLRHRVSGAEVRAAEFNLVQLRQQIASQTARAYDALLVALRHRADLEQGDSLAHDFLTKTQVRFEAGSVPKLDVIKARVDLAQAQNNLLSNARDMANARSALNRFLGRSLGAALEPADTLVVPPPLPDLDTLQASALTTRPELRGLASQRAGAGSAASLAQQYWLPDLSLGVSKDLTQGTNAYTTSIGFSIPLFFWNHQRGEVAEARHHERELDAAYTDLEAQVEQDVRGAYATAATALQQAVYLRDALVPEAREAYDISLLSYGLGGSSALDVLDARRTLLDAESQYADALGAANDARADLERAVAQPLDRFAGGRNDR